MDQDLEESIDFDFFEDNSPTEATNVKPVSPRTYTSKPPVPAHSSKPLSNSDNVIKRAHDEINLEPHHKHGFPLDKNPVWLNGEHLNSNKESVSLEKRKVDAKSRNTRSRSPSSTSSSRSNSSSSSLLPDSVKSNLSQSDSERSMRDKGHRSRSSSRSGSVKRPTNPLAKSEKLAVHKDKLLEYSSSEYSDNDSRSEKSSTVCDDNGDFNHASKESSKKQAWVNVKVAKPQEKKLESVKLTETRNNGRPKTATKTPKKVYRDPSPNSCSQSSTVSDSDITDVSPIDSPRNGYQDKYNGKRKEASRINSTGDGHPAKITFKVVDEEHQKDHTMDQDYDPDKITGLDLNILMKAVGELEKQKRVRANSRRVAFAAPSLKNVEKGNYTFDRDQTRNIEMENYRLLKEIVQQGNCREHRKQFYRPSTSYKLTPSAINREREIQRIERENLALLKRLQEVKPTKAICRDHQLRTYENTVYHGVPIAALHHQPHRRRAQHCVVDDSGSSVGGHAHSVRSISSATSSVRSVGSNRSSRPNSASVQSGSNTRRTDSRPAWSDRW